MRVRLEKLDRARREFIANASHELRTPLFSLGGFLELMADEELDEATRQEFLETMREQVERLAKLATDLLDLSRLDAGRMRVEHEPVDLGDVAQLVAEEFARRRRASGHRLEVVVDGRPIARADELRVLQVGRALVDNALVHTPPGTQVTLRAYADREHAYLEVEDDGPGVPAEHAPHVFDRFYRAEGGVASGSGLGLAIARELATVMDGDGRARVRAGTDGRPGRARRRADVGGRPHRSARAFPRENGAVATQWPMRPGALAVVALVAAVLGATAVLLVGSPPAGSARAKARAPSSSRRRRAETGAVGAVDPLLGNGFDPAKIYAGRSGGVVTIYPFFGSGQRSQGSGFVVSDEGHVLTNSHVVTDAGEGKTVHGASRVYVVFADGDRIPGEIVGWDLFNDIGVVKVDPRDHAVTPVPLGDSSRVVVGEPVAAIGSPFGQESSLAVGVVSATERSIQSLTSDYDVSGAIQIDAPINHGNSGGPLLDARGRVIGINAQIRSDSGNAEGVGFAIPINSARRSMEQLISTGKVTYAYVGVTTQDVTPAVARRFDLGAQRGALIQSVVDGCAGGCAGLHGGSDLERFNGISISLGGDLIVSFAGERVERAADIAAIVTESAPARSDRLRHRCPRWHRQARDGPSPPDRASAEPERAEPV